jgi:mono/diheme cytochrome c family protein
MAFSLLVAPIARAAQRGAAKPVPAAAQPEAAKNAASGRLLFEQYGCYGCHGYTGETGNPRLLGSKSKNMSTEAEFIRFLRLRADQAPVQPSTRMPNYPENSLGDKQASDIYAYLRSLKSGTPELKDVATLNQIIKAASRPYKP